MPTSLAMRPLPAKAQIVGNPSAVSSPGGAKNLGTPLFDASPDYPDLTLVEVLLEAAKRSGIEPKELQSIVGLTEWDFSKAMSLAPHNRERNRPMKAAMPNELWRQMSLVIAERTGMKHDAAMHVIRAMGDFLTVTVTATREVKTTPRDQAVSA